MWQLILIITVLKGHPPEAPIMWDKQKNIAAVIDDTEYDKLYDCLNQGALIKSKSKNVIDYQCRGEI